MILQDKRYRTHLPWLVSVISLPLLLVAAQAAWRVHRTQRTQTEVALVDHANNASHSVDRALERLKGGLLVLAGSNALGRGDMDGFLREMRLFSGRFDGIQVSLTAPDTGSVLRVGGTQSGLPAGGASVHQAAIAALRTGEAVVTNLLPDNDPKRALVAVAVPAFRPGESAPAFVLVGSLGGAQLKNLAGHPPSHPNGMAITILARVGTIVARSPRSDPHGAEPPPPVYRQPVEDRQSGMLADDTAVEGMPAIQAFSKAPLS